MRIDANAEGASVEASTQELGEVAEAMGLQLSAQQNQEEMATEQATETATAQESVVGEAGAPTAGLSKLLKMFYKNQSAPHDIHQPNPTGRVDATVGAMNDPSIQAPIDVEMPPPTIVNMSDDDILDLVNSPKTTEDGDEASHVMNFRTLEDDEIAATMEKLANVNKTAIDKQRRGTISIEETGLAARLLQSDPDFVKEVLTMKAGTALPAEKILALGQMVELLLKDINILARQAGTDPQAMEAAKKYINTYDKIYQSFMGARAEQGRGLNILQHINTEGDNRAVQLAAMLQQREHGLTDEAIIKSLSATETPQETADMIVASRPSLFERSVDTLIELRMNSMLSGGTTHIVNFLGSAIRTGADVIDVGVGAFFNRNDPNFDKIAFGEWKAKSFSLMYSQQKAWEAAKRAWKTGEKYGDVDKLDDPEYAPKISTEYWGVNPESKWGKLLDLTGNILRIPTQRLMGATDAYNKYMAEQSSLAGQAFSRVQHMKKQNPDLDSDAALVDLLNNPTEEMRLRATQDGESMTFQEDLGDGFAKDAQKLTGYRPVKLVVPFYKTPVNLMKQGFLERTPMGYKTKEWKADMEAGGRRAQMAKSKMATGTGVSLSMFYLATEGLLTGHYSKDKQIRDAQMASGWKPMSLKIPRDDGTTTYISIDRMEPFSYLFGMAADIGALFQEGQLRDLTETEDERYKELVGVFTLAVADNTLNKTFMTGIKDAIDATQGGYKGENFVKRFVGSFMPFSATARNIAQGVDPTIRRPDGLYEYWADSMTLWNKDAAPVVDSLGNERYRENVFMPWLPINKNPGVLEKKMLEVSNLTGQALVPYVSRSLGGVRLTPNQQATWAKIARKDSDFVKQATDIINGPDFKDMFVTTQIDIISDLVKAYDGKWSENGPTGAAAMLLEQYPDLKKKIYRLKLAPSAQQVASEQNADPKQVLEGMLNDAGF